MRGLPEVATGFDIEPLGDNAADDGNEFLP